MKNRFRIAKTVLIFTLLSAIVLTVAGCKEKDYDPSKKVGIDKLEVISATGNKDNWNNLLRYNRWDDSEYSAWLRSDKAMKLIDEINKLPDVFGDDSDPYAYKIDIVYYDANSEWQCALKLGYGGFPDNWGTIVAYVNEITPDRHKKLADSTDIVTFDSAFLRENFDISDDMLPEGVTVDGFLEDTGLTYEDVSSGSFHMDIYVSNYKYGYYGIASHRITEDTQGSRSDAESLRSYAEENLDTIGECGDISITGNYQKYGFEIVRFDRFEEWKQDRGVSGYRTRQDKTVDIYYETDAHFEEKMNYEDYYVYVDPSNRFLIITKCKDYDVINAFFNRA